MTAAVTQCGLACFDLAVSAANCGARAGRDARTASRARAAVRRHPEGRRRAARRRRGRPCDGNDLLLDGQFCDVSDPAHPGGCPSIGRRLERGRILVGRRWPRFRTRATRAARAAATGATRARGSSSSGGDDGSMSSTDGNTPLPDGETREARRGHHAVGRSNRHAGCVHASVRFAGQLRETAASRARARTRCVRSSMGATACAPGVHAAAHAVQGRCVNLRARPQQLRQSAATSARRSTATSRLARERSRAARDHHRPRLRDREVDRSGDQAPRQLGLLQPAHGAGALVRALREQRRPSRTRRRSSRRRKPRTTTR